MVSSTATRPKWVRYRGCNAGMSTRAKVAMRLPVATVTRMQNNQPSKGMRSWSGNRAMKTQPARAAGRARARGRRQAQGAEPTQLRGHGTQAQQQHRGSEYPQELVELVFRANHQRG